MNKLSIGYTRKVTAISRGTEHTGAKLLKNTLLSHEVSRTLRPSGTWKVTHTECIIVRHF